MEMQEVETKLADIETRLSEIEKELDTNKDANVEELSKEVDELTEQRSAVLKDIETRKATLEKIATGNGVVVTDLRKEEKENMEERVLDRNSAEYRSAFFKSLLGTELNELETRALTTESGVALPVTTEKAIYDAVSGRHTILGDINLYKTGTVLDITVHKAITKGKAAKKAEAEANDMEENTFAKVSLAGSDFVKTVELSYAAATMTQGALEDYLVSEISAGIADALADEVFAELLTNTATDNVKVVAKPAYADIMAMLGSLKRTSNMVIYCSNATKYTKIMAMVDANGQPIFRDGCALGIEVKVDDAAGDNIVALDPKKFVGNMVQDITIENAKDISRHVNVFSGYCRFGGALIDAEACAIIKAA